MLPAVMGSATSKCSGAIAMRYIFRNVAAVPLPLQNRYSGATLALLLFYTAILIRVNCECVNHDATMQFDLFQCNSSSIL